jgi:hypothetical protein
MKPKQVRELDEQFKEFKYTNFVSNLWNLRKSVNQRKEPMEFDRRVLQHDQRLYPAPSITHIYFQMLDIHYGQVCKQKSFSRQALMKERTRH